MSCSLLTLGAGQAHLAPAPASSNNPRAWSRLPERPRGGRV